MRGIASDRYCTWGEGLDSVGFKLALWVGGSAAGDNNGWVEGGKGWREEEETGNGAVERFWWREPGGGGVVDLGMFGRDFLGDILEIYVVKAHLLDYARSFPAFRES